MTDVMLDRPDLAPPLTPRQERILDLVRAEQMVEVARLAETLGVSAVTVRADLDSLDRRQLLRRIRGGATAIRPARFERPVDLPGESFASEKQRIGALAARLVRDGETIILDAGTTTLAMALALPPDLRDIVVVTSSLDIALALESHDGVRVIVTGGTVKKTGRRARARSLIPPFAALLLRQINADCAYLCCAGVDAERGFTNAHFEEAELKQTMITSSRRAVFLADHGKIGHVAGARIAGLAEAQTLVTDTGAPAADLAALEAAGLQVLVA